MKGRRSRKSVRSNSGRTRSSGRTRNLGLEQLESRVVLAGNVRAFLSGGVLRIDGDGRANEITITQRGLRSFTVESRDGSTTINGQPGPRRFVGVRDDVNITMRGGNDVVEIVGTSRDAVTVSDRLFIDMGAGADEVLLTEVHAIGVHINTGSGNDLLNIGQDGAEGGLEVTKEAIILTGSGQDEAIITNSLFKRFMNLNMGSNNDETTLLENRFRRTSIANGTSGFDTLNRESNAGPIRYISYNRIRNSVEAPTPVPPVAANDTATVARGGSQTINVAANDTSGTSPLNLGSITITSQPTNGTVTVNNNGTVTYTNNGNAAATDSFSYTIRDQQGRLSNPATVAITVTAAIAAANDAGAVTEEAAQNTVTGNLLTNDANATGATVTAVNGAAGNVGTSVVGKYGTFSVGANGQYTYTLDNSDPDLATLDTGETDTDTITYTASLNGQSSTATLTITVTGVNDTLAAVNDAGAVTENAAQNTATGNVLTNDANATGAVVSAVNGAADNVGTNVVGKYGTFSIGANGQYTYTLDNSDPDLATLDTGETDTDTVTYTASVNGQNSTATLTIAVTGVNEPLAAVNDAGAVTEDAAQSTATGNVLANDTNATGATVSAVNGAAGNVGTNVVGKYGTFSVGANGQYTYALDNSDPDLATLDTDETDTDTVTYTASLNGQTSTATLTITVTGVNDFAAANDTGAVTEDAAQNTAAGNVLTNDANTTGVAVTAVNGAPANVGTSVVGKYGTFSIGSDGQYTYTLDNSDPDLATLDTEETDTDTVTYTANTANGQPSTATLTITVTGANDFAAANDTGAVTEDASPNTATGDVLANDANTTGVSVTAVNGVPGNVGSNVVGKYGTFSIGVNGQYTYTLDNSDPDLATLDAGETDTDTVTYTANTTNGQPSTATLTITVTGANDFAAVDDAGAVTEDAAPNTATGNVLTNDANATGVTVTAVNGAPGNVGTNVVGKYGTFSIGADGQYTYALDNSDPDLATLDAGETDTDTITYTAGTTNGQPSTATLTITVTGANEPPLTAVDDTDGVTEDATENTATGNVLTNDQNATGATVSEVNGSAANVGANVQGTFGTFSITSTGEYTYTLDNADTDLATLDDGETAPDTVTYTASLNGQTSTATLTVTVTGVNEPPPVAAVPDEGNVIEDDPDNTVEGNVLTNDTGGGPNHTVTEVNGVAGNVGTTVNGNFGTFQIDSDGNYTYTLDNANTQVNNLGAGATLEDEITYTVGDGSTTSSSTLTITIQGADT